MKRCFARNVYNMICPVFFPVLRHEKYIHFFFCNDWENLVCFNYIRFCPERRRLFIRELYNYHFCSFRHWMHSGIFPIVQVWLWLSQVKTRRTDESLPSFFYLYCVSGSGSSGKPAPQTRTGPHSIPADEKTLSRDAFRPECPVCNNFPSRGRFTGPGNTSVVLQASCHLSNSSERLDAVCVFLAVKRPSVHRGWP